MNRQGRVLVVDDLEKWRKTLVEALKREGFHVDSASTAAQVLELLNETFYHLLLLDIRLNDSDQSNIDGMELLLNLQQRRLSEAIKVIMLSAHDTKEQIITAFAEHGVADFLPKDNFTQQVFLE